MGRRGPVVALGAVMLAGAAVLAPATTAATRVAVQALPYDFNGDGFADLAAGVPGEDIGRVANAGAVGIIYGSARGLTAAGDQSWNQDGPGVPGAAEHGDFFGSVSTSGDFNGDGFADLAVGVPGEAIGTVVSGAVSIVYGSRTGLTGAGSQFFSQSTAGVPGASEARDEFGAALTAGDFDGDGRSDLAIGAPGEDIGPAVNNDRGAVTVLYGTAAGLSTARTQSWNGENLGFGTEGGSFGRDVEVADVTGDGRAELVAVGAAVYLVRGGARGLTADNAQRWTVNDTALPDVLPTPGAFTSAALGDVDADGYADLVAGSPFASFTPTTGDQDRWCQPENPGACDGAVVELRGGPGGFTGAGQQVFHRQVTGMPVVAPFFGRAVAAGDLNQDGAAEVAVSSGDEDTGGGTVAVLTAAAGSGVSTAGARAFKQGQGVSGADEETDDFGDMLRIAPFGSRAGLAISVTGEALGSIDAAGRVAVLYSDGDALTSTGQQSWSQDDPEIIGVAEAGDRFGALGSAAEW